MREEYLGFKPFGYIPVFSKLASVVGGNRTYHPGVGQHHRNDGLGQGLRVLALVEYPTGSLTVKKAKTAKIIGLQFGRTNFCPYLCSNTRYYHPRVFAFL